MKANSEIRSLIATAIELHYQLKKDFESVILKNLLHTKMDNALTNLAMFTPTY
jgi:hypothetical protein